MEEQHKTEHQQINMDLNIDPRTETRNHLHVVEKEFMGLTLRQQRDLIKLLPLYKRGVEMEFSELIIKIRDGRVVHAEAYKVTRWGEKAA